MTGCIRGQVGCGRGQVGNGIGQVGNGIGQVGLVGSDNAIAKSTPPIIPNNIPPSIKNHTYQEIVAVFSTIRRIIPIIAIIIPIMIKIIPAIAKPDNAIFYY
jgi:hypothetical protein